MGKRLVVLATVDDFTALSMVARELLAQVGALASATGSAAPPALRASAPRVACALLRRLNTLQSVLLDDDTPIEPAATLKGPPDDDPT